MLILSSSRLGATWMRNKFEKVLGTDLSDKKLLIIPCASTNEEKAGAQAIEDALNFGFKREHIFIFSVRSFSILGRIYTEPKYDYIYVTGGNTFKLLHDLKNCGYDKRLRKIIIEGATYIGSSAGAYLISKDISHIQKYDENNYGIDDFSGLGILDARLICHFDNDRYYDYYKLRMSTSDVLFTIDDDSILVVDKDNIYYI